MHPRHDSKFLYFFYIYNLLHPGGQTVGSKLLLIHSFEQNHYNVTVFQKHKSWNDPNE